MSWSTVGLWQLAFIKSLVVDEQSSYCEGYETVAPGKCIPSTSINIYTNDQFSTPKLADLITLMTNMLHSNIPLVLRNMVVEYKLFATRPRIGDYKLINNLVPICLQTDQC